MKNIGLARSIGVRANLQLFSKHTPYVFNAGVRGRRQYPFETYFDHEDYEKAKNHLFKAKICIMKNIDLARSVGIRANLQLFSKSTPYICKVVL